MDAVNYSYSSDGSMRSDAFSFAAINLKAGLCHRTDLQVVIEPTFRKVGSDVNFGMNVGHRTTGTIRVGDPVTLND
jgi:hypothetical protein